MKTKIISISNVQHNEQNCEALLGAVIAFIQHGQARKNHQQFKCLTGAATVFRSIYYFVISIIANGQRKPVKTGDWEKKIVQYSMNICVYF